MAPDPQPASAWIDDAAAAATPALEQPSGSTYAPGEGLTVSMLEGTSTLKLFGQFSLLGVFSTTRPFPSGNPFFLFPLLDPANDTNTFDLHARQTAFGAAFTGPEVKGLTPGAQFLAFLFSDNFVSDNYGFLPVAAYGELKDDQSRFAGGL